MSFLSFLTIPLFCELYQSSRHSPWVHVLWYSLTCIKIQVRLYFLKAFKQKLLLDFSTKYVVNRSQLSSLFPLFLTIDPTNYWICGRPVIWSLDFSPLGSGACRLGLLLCGEPWNGELAKIGYFQHRKLSDNKQRTVKVRWGIFIENLTVFFYS